MTRRDVHLAWCDVAEQHKKFSPMLALGGPTACANPVRGEPTYA